MGLIGNLAVLKKLSGLQCFIVSGVLKGWGLFGSFERFSAFMRLRALETSGHSAVKKRSTIWGLALEQPSDPEPQAINKFHG